MSRTKTLDKLLEEHSVAKAVSINLEEVMRFSDWVEGVNFAQWLENKFERKETHDLIMKAIIGFKRHLDDLMMLSTIYLKEEKAIEDMLDDMYGEYEEENKEE